MEFKEKLRLSGLEINDAKRLKFKELSARECQALGHETRRGIFLPYFTLAGKLDPKMYRIRYLDPPVGFSAAAKKIAKYTQPRNQRPRPYLPPLVNWAKIARDPGQLLILTEGELKAAKATKEALPTIGLGGVSSWRAGRRGITFLPELEEFVWAERDVYIIYDSDIIDKPDVAREARLLADELTSRGANAALVTLPSGDDKVGLDDFLVVFGKTRLEELLTQASTFKDGAPLWEMNERFCYVRGNVNMVFDVEDKVFVRTRDFHERHADLQPLVFHTEKSTTKVARTKAWLEWPHRRNARGVVFDPGKPFPVTREGMINLWTGFSVEPTKGDVQPWKLFLKNFFRGDQDKIKWFEQWLAYPFQYPGAKLYSAVFIYGNQGGGKTLLAEIIRRLYGQHFYMASFQDLGQWTSWLRNVAFVVGNELVGGDRRAHAELIKSWITDPMIRTEAKGENSISVENHVNFMFNSNQPNALLVEGDDRRFFVHESPVVVEHDEADQHMRKSVDPWMRDPAGPAALLHYLLHLDTGSFNPKSRPPVTMEKALVQEASRTDVQQWVADFIENPPGIFSGRDLFTAGELANYRNATESGKRVAATVIGIEMGKMGYRVFQQKPGLGSSIYALRTVEKYQAMKYSALRRELEKQRGGSVLG